MVDSIDIGFVVKDMIHPTGYINKVLVYNDNNMKLVNIVSKECVYNYLNNEECSKIL